MPEKLSCERSLTNAGTNGGCILPGVPSCHRAAGASRGWAAVAMSWPGGGLFSHLLPFWFAEVEETGWLRCRGDPKCGPCQGRRAVVELGVAVPQLRALQP